MGTLKSEQKDLQDRWQEEQDKLVKVQTLKEEIERVGVEIANAERAYDLNKAAELKYGTLMGCNVLSPKLRKSCSLKKTIRTSFYQMKSPKTISQKSSRNGPGSQSQNYNKVKERSF